MSERKYSVSEVDKIRAAVTMREDMTTFRDRPYYPDERIKHIEELVRTYIIAGVSADNVADECNKVIANMQEMMRQLQRQR